MSPELERILQARWVWQHCDPKDDRRLKAILEQLITEALEGKPDVSRQHFLEALNERYYSFVKAQRRPPTMPPSA